MTCVPGQPAAPVSASAPRASDGYRSPACRGRVSPLYQSRLVILIRQYAYWQQASLNPMKRRLAPSPASPLIPRFGRPDRQKQPPVRRRQEASGKCLIYITLSRMRGSNLSIESMIRPVFPLLQGRGICRRAPGVCLSPLCPHPSLPVSGSVSGRGSERRCYRLRLRPRECMLSATRSTP
jgi:hypothetical protein